MKNFLIHILIFVFLCFNTKVWASDLDIINSQKETLNISNFITEANKYTKEFLPDIDMGDMLNLAISGKIENDDLFSKIISFFGKELKIAIKTLASILVIIVITSILKVISENLENKSIAKITYYVQYILIVTLMFSNFTEIVNMAKNSITNLIGFIQNLMPILVVLMVSTGATVSANLMQPVILVLINIIGNLLVNVIIPLVLAGTVLGVISNISEKIQINNLAKFFKSSVLWILGIVLAIFVSVLSIEGTLGSSIDGITTKTAKAAISNLVPIVGKALGDSIDTVLGSAVILKNAIGVVGVVVIISICIGPVIKLIVFYLTYNIALLLAEPIADKSIVKLLSQFADSLKVLLAIVFVVSAMFLIGITIVIRLSNASMMYR